MAGTFLTAEEIITPKESKAQGLQKDVEIDRRLLV